SVSDPTCRSFYGAYAPDSWYDESSVVLDPTGAPTATGAADVDERAARTEILAWRRAASLKRTTVGNPTRDGREMATELDDLRERVRTLEDKEEIRNLIQAYRKTLDERDLRAFSELFASNGTWTGRSGKATGPHDIHSMLTAALPDNPPA